MTEIEYGLTQTWTPHRLARLLTRTDTNAYALVTTIVDEPRDHGASKQPIEHCAGFSIATFGSEHAHLVLHAIAPGLRRTGYGRQLLDWQIRAAITAGISTLTLELRAGNDAALAFYRKLGFEVIGRRAGYYEQREDALRMRLSPLAVPVH